MGNVSLKVLEKSLNFLFQKGYEPCSYRSQLWFERLYAVKLVHMLFASCVNGCF